jgi:chaperonin GroES
LNIKPLGDRVVVKPTEAEEVTKSGIVLPETAKEKPQQGKVIAVGSGEYIDGKKVALEVKTGDKVIYSKYAGTEFKMDDDKYLILKENDILGIIE